MNDINKETFEEFKQKLIYENVNFDQLAMRLFLEIDYSTLLNNKLLQCKIIANDTLYFADGSDYQGALWDILRVITPLDFIDNNVPKLKYIGE